MRLSATSIVEWGADQLAKQVAKEGMDVKNLRIVVANEPDGTDLVGIEHQWCRLQQQCVTLTPFQTWEWNIAWWRHLGVHRRQYLLLFYADTCYAETQVDTQAETELVGIAPLCIGSYLGSPVRRLAWIGTGNSDYLGPVVRTGYEDAVASALHAHLSARSAANPKNKAPALSGGWDFADLQQIRSGSPLLNPVEQNREQGTGKREEGNEPGGEETNSKDKEDKNKEDKNKEDKNKEDKRRAADVEELALPMEACPYLPLPDNWKAFTARLGKSLRSNLGYYDRLLHRTFIDVHYHLAGSETLDAGLTALFMLHQRRWNARWLPGALGSAKVQAFHREVARAFLAKGWLRLHLLTIGESTQKSMQESTKKSMQESMQGTIQAALYCFALNGRTFYYLGGFAPEMARYSLGTLLTARAIRHAIEEGGAEFDFLRGEEPYKARWQPINRMNYRLLMRSMRNAASRESASDSFLARSVGFWRGASEWPGRAGFALNRVERYIVHRAKSFAARRSGAHSGTGTRQS